ncbi:MAG: RHS repeat-associated core domain-containing protein, partial [Acidobacteriota bacterium]
SVRRGYEYEAVLRRTRSAFNQAWAQQPGGSFPTRVVRGTSRGITLWRETVSRLDTIVRPTVGGLDAKGFGFGGWNVDVHHVYDPARRTLYRGDGTQRVSWALGPVLNLFAGLGISGYDGDGGNAKAARFDAPGDLAVGPDGSVYVADRNNYVVRRIAPDGVVTTVAGSGERCDLFSGGKSENTGDEGKGGGGPGGGEPCAEDLPVLDASFADISGIDVDRFGRLYIVDTAQRCALRVEFGVLRRVAGACEVPDGGVGGKGERDAGEGFGDGGPAADAFFAEPIDIAVMPDGAFYISDRDVDLVRYVIGGRIYSIDNGEGSFFMPQSLHATSDGTLYIAENNRIVRYDRAGILTVIAGTGVNDVSPDGADAATSPISEPGAIVATADGRVYFIEEGARRVRTIDVDGRLRTAAGTGMFGDTAPGSPARAADLRGPRGLAIAPSGVVLLADAFQDRIFALEGPMGDYDDDGYQITEADGSLIYEFDELGRHQRTTHALTGATLLSFGYDDGLLTSITDGDGQTTTVLRGDTTTTITSPFGQVSTLGIDAQGDLATFTNPASEAHTFTYGFGLMETATDPRSGAKEYLYDERGRLEQADDEGDGRQRFDRFKRRRGDDDHTVRRRTREGVERRYTLRKWSTGEELRRQRLPNREIIETTSNRATGATTTVFPSDLQRTTTRAPDPRFGMQAGFAGASTTRLPSGLTRERQETQEAVLSNPADVTSLVSLHTTSTVNGRSSSRVYDAASRRWTSTSAQGRPVIHEIDTQGRATRLITAAVEPLSIRYNAAGFTERMTQGDDALTQRVTDFTYDPLNRLESMTDSVGLTTTFSYDDANRMTGTILPDLQQVTFGYDTNGNLTSITPPGRPGHTFGYTPTNLLERHTLPDAGTGVSIETRHYDRDRRLRQITRPDGEILTFDYDPVEQQVVSLTTARGAITYRYDEPTDQLAMIVDPDGETLDMTYDGPLLRELAWSGTIGGTIGWTYDSDFRPASTTVNGIDPIAIGYDDDDLVISAGALTVVRHTDTPRESTTALGDVTTSRTYTAFGEPDVYTVRYDGAVVYSEDLDYDKRSRITDITRTQNGTTTTWQYVYDLRGRLERVTRDGVPFATYGYDANSNRIEYDGTFGTVTAAEVTVDVRDRLLRYGDRTYAYTDAGELTTQTQGGTTALYDYDALGNLRTADLGDGTVIGYVTDGVNRRIGRTVNGTLTQGFLYQDLRNPIAELDGAGAVVSRFVYATRSNVPDYVIKAGVTYRIITDHTSSPRLVIDAATGAIAQELRYDAFGRVTLDTNPGFQPFGFAGGLYDAQVGLVRLGARDYDPRLGRWTASDRALFRGRQLNLYAYAANDPINLIDFSGRDAIFIHYDFYPVPTGFGDYKAPLGHAAVIAVNPENGFTQYYEFGRYGNPNGKVRRKGIPNLEMGDNGLPTEESLDNLINNLESREELSKGKNVSYRYLE